MSSLTGESALELALEILTGIEEGSLPAERSLMKASRLARLRRDEVAEAWIALERDGYAAETARSNSGFYESSRAFMDQKHDVHDGVPVLAQRARVLRTQLEQLRLPDVSGEYASIALRETRNDISSVANLIQRYEGVLGAVEKRVHSYAANVYHAIAFSQSAEGVFEVARAAIEPMILEADSDLVRKLDYAARSLAEHDDEAISAATNSLRRLLTVFADIAFPAQPFPREGADGKEILLGRAQYLNRIKAFIDDNCHSDSRRRSLKQRVTFINERTSTGVHVDVSREEARFILVNTYILLGEILSLGGSMDGRDAVHAVAPTSP